MSEPLNGKENVRRGRRLRPLLLFAAVVAVALALSMRQTPVPTPPEPAPVQTPTQAQEKISPLSPDYSKAESWAYLGVGEEKSADLFLIAPTVDLGIGGEKNMDVANERSRESFTGALNMERGIYEDVTRMYAPFYRQVAMSVYFMSEEEARPYFDLAYGDVRAAFLYYMEHCNAGRPLVLAGFSQGSDLVLRLMEELFGDERYSRLLAAAYCIGWRVTDEDLKKYPHLRMAEGEEDTGVIISFNSETEGVKGSAIIPEGVRTRGINPLNWSTDGAAADKSLNRGACFTDYSGAVKSEIPALTGARLDMERGSLIVTDVSSADYVFSKVFGSDYPWHAELERAFPQGVLHLQDYMFFYRNLQENVRKRVERFTQSAD